MASGEIKGARPKRIRRPRLKVEGSRDRRLSGKARVKARKAEQRALRESLRS